MPAYRPYQTATRPYANSSGYSGAPSSGYQGNQPSHTNPDGSFNPTPYSTANGTMTSSGYFVNGGAYNPGSGGQSGGWRGGTAYQPYASGNTASGNFGGPDNIGTISRTKNPQLNDLENAGIGQVSKTNEANTAAVDAYGNAIASNQANANYFNGQETGAIGDVYNGNAQKNLTGQIDQYAKNQNDLIGGVKNDLTAGRDAYNANETAAIEKEKTDRAGLEGDYKKTAQGTLDSLIDQLSTNRSAYQTASQKATDLAIAGQERTLKAQGNPYSSYFGRADVGVRNAAQTALQTDLANRGRADLLTGNQQQVALNSDLADRIRADYGLTRQESEALASNLDQQQRGDTGFVYGQQAGVGQNVLTQGLNAYQSILARQAQEAGLRNNIQNQTAANELLPAQARNQMLDQYLQQQQQVGAIDRGNRTYGVDDGTGALGSGAYRSSVSGGNGGFADLSRSGGPTTSAPSNGTPSNSSTGITSDSLFKDMEAGKITRAQYYAAYNALTSGRDPAAALKNAVATVNPTPSYFEPPNPNNTDYGEENPNLNA